MNYDWHTHFPREHAMVSLPLERLVVAPELEDCRYTLEMHPWNLPEVFMPLGEEFCRVAASPKVYALGEIGLDKLQGPSFEIQLDYFRELLLLAEKLAKPVVLHVVRAWPEARKCLKEVQLKEIYYHGFRSGGSVTQLLELLQFGCFVTFRPPLRPEWIAFLREHPEWRGRIGLESDGRTMDLAEEYRKLEF